MQASFDAGRWPAADGGAIEAAWAQDADAITDLVRDWRAQRARFEGVGAFLDLERLALERTLRDRPIIFLVARQGETIVGYAAFMPVDGKMSVSFGLKTLFRLKVDRLRMLGGDVAVARDADEPAVMRALFGRLAEDGRSLATIEECPEMSRVHRHPSALAPFKLKALDKDPQVIHTVDVPESFDAYLKMHKGKTRNTLKRRVRVFNESFEGGARIERIDTPEKVPGYVAAVGAIFDRSWKRGVLSESPPVTDADIPYLTALAERGVLRSYVLYGGDAPICCSLMTQNDGVCDFLDVLFVQEHAQLAPGQVLIMKTIEDFFSSEAGQESPVEFNFGYGDNAYKRVFGTRSYAANYYYAFRPYSKAAAVVSSQLALRSVYHAARKAVVALKIDHKIRKLLKRGG